MANLVPKNTLMMAVIVTGLGGCASNVDRYPSLSIRDFERVEGVFEVAGPEIPFEEPVPPDELTTTKVAQLLDRARMAHQSFVDLVPRVEGQIRAMRGLSPEDNAWSDGQIALAELDIKRGQLAVLLGDLDLLFANASQSYQQLDEIEAAREQVRSLVAEEDRLILSILAQGG